MAATQEQLYAGLDLDLSWSEKELPERERDVIKLRFGLNGDREPLPLTQVGQRVGVRATGVPGRRVSTLHATWTANPLSKRKEEIPTSFAQ